MSNITELAWRTESTFIDFQVLQNLVAEHGEHQADRLIADTAETIAIRLCGLRRMLEHQAWDMARFESRRIIALAQKIGMRRMSEVASMIEDCAIRGDGVAMNAVIARLERLEEVSLFGIWGLDSETP